MGKISLLLTTSLILLTSFPANAALNMGGQTIFAGTVIEVLEPGPATQIQAIIDNITDASASNPYLIQLGPGVYDLGDSAIVMKEWVSIQGSGQESTKLTRITSSTLQATVVGADNVSLTDMTVENKAGYDFSVGIYNLEASPRLERLKIIASGSNGGRNYGIYNQAESSPIITDVRLEVFGGYNNRGIYLSSGTSITNVDVNMESELGYSGQFKIGVFNSSAGTYTTLTNVNVFVSGAVNNTAIRNDGSGIMHNVTAIAVDESAANADGLVTIGPASPFVTSSIFKGTTNGVRNNHFGSSTSGVRIVYSKIVGGVYSTIIGVQCHENYDEDLANVSCPISPP